MKKRSARSRTPREGYRGAATPGPVAAEAVAEAATHAGHSTLAWIWAPLGNHLTGNLRVARKAVQTSG